MLPRPLVEEYWDRVVSVIGKQCHLSDESARLAVSRFRAEIEPKVGDMIYHEKAETVANTVVNAIKNGEYVDNERKGA